MIADITIVPIGTGAASVSPFVKAAFEVLRASGLKYQVGPMSTSVEGDWEIITAVIRRMQEACFKLGAVRLLTTIRVDERRDKAQTMADKVRRLTADNRPNSCEPRRTRRTKGRTTSNTKTRRTRKS